MRIAVTGSNGRVGGALVDSLRLAGHEVTALTRREVPLDQEYRLRRAVDSIEVDAWINPAALSSPDACENDPHTSHAVNAKAPAIMADECRRLGRYFLHFSTDYVFSGIEPGKKKECDVTEPVNVYGRHKREGEKAVMTSGARATVLRVSWIYGARVPAFVEQCLQRLAAGETIHAIADKWSIPTAMTDLCHWVEFLLREQPQATLHGCHSGEPVSWYGIALHLQRTRMLTGAAKIHATNLTEAAHFIAKRPVHTAMDNQLLSSLLPQPIADWKDAMNTVIARA